MMTLTPSLNEPKPPKEWEKRPYPKGDECVARHGETGDENLPQMLGVGDWMQISWLTSGDFLGVRAPSTPVGNPPIDK